jgi:AcrR family transcriptional regulator
MKRRTDAVADKPERGPTLAAEQRIKQIVHEAAKLFDRVGYHEANMEMVAQAAQMRKPTLYHYIKSKEEILLRIHQTLLEDLRAKHKERVDKGQSREELLLGIVTEILRQIAMNRGYVRVFLEHYRELDPVIRKQISSERQDYFKIVTDLIAQGVASGDYHTNDVRLSAVLLLGQVNWAYQWYQPGVSAAPEVIAQELLDTFLYGLTRKVSERTAARKAMARMAPVKVPLSKAGVAAKTAMAKPVAKATKRTTVKA